MARSSNSQAGGTTSTSSVRRNLFTNHLSHRRPEPASTNQPSEPSRDPSANSSTQSLSNPSNAPPPRRPTSRTQSNDSLHNASANYQSRNNTDLLSSSLSRNGDIIARDRSGRPDLPEIPILPPQLRLSSSEHQEAAQAEEGTGMEDVEGLELESAMREKEDQERIEKSLVDMMYRSRMRGNGHHGHGGAGLGTENEELLALVQASLRKKAASLEEDRWMFEGEVGDDYSYGFR